MFCLPFSLLFVGHGGRQILWFGIASHPTAEWTAHQITEACGWEQVPRYLTRDRDRAYGQVFIRRLRSMGIRECIDHIVVVGERHLRHVLLSYMNYYNETRTGSRGQRCCSLTMRTRRSSRWDKDLACIIRRSSAVSSGRWRTARWQHSTTDRDRARSR